jgi:hypothetical protein
LTLCLRSFSGYSEVRTNKGRMCIVDWNALKDAVQAI